MKSVRRHALRAATAAVASGALAAGGLALATSASAGVLSHRAAAMTYSFRTLDNMHDLTFNQLLGINNQGVIAGYFGSGASGHPNKGYLLWPPYGQGSYLNENFPGSVQTQVTGLNNHGVTVGFWSSMNNANNVNDNHGFVEFNGNFFKADYPAAAPATPPVDQLLGVNDNNVAVGFYTDANGTSHGYRYNITTHKYSLVTDPFAPGTSLTAAALNSHGDGDVAGFYTNPATGSTDGFLKLRNHSLFIDLAVPGASSTMAFGVNNNDEVVGVYTPAANPAAMHGFTWTSHGGFTTVDDPNGIGTTTVNGINDRGQLVGFYTDSAGNTDGFLASPAS